MSLSLGGLRHTLPGASSEELRVAFVARLYGPHLAAEVRVDLATRRP
jgi:hypothetical protein